MNTSNIKYFTAAGNMFICVARSENAKIIHFVRLHIGARHRLAEASLAWCLPPSSHSL